MLKNGLFVVLALGTLVSCATIVQKPGVYQVRKLALVSVYINSVVGDVENRKASQPTIVLLKLNLGLTDPDQARKQAIADGAEKSAEEALATVPNWTVVPLEQIVNNPAYAAMKSDTEAALASAQHLETGLGPAHGGEATSSVTADKLAFVPVSAIPVGGISIIVTGDGKTITQDDVKHYWGKLASDLGVDAVAIVFVDLAYKKNFFSGVHIPLVIASADANVDASIVAITKDGKLALNSGGLTGQRLAGGGAPMLMGGDTFTLGDDKKEALNEFNRIIKLKLQQIAQKLVEELKGS